MGKLYIIRETDDAESYSLKYQYYIQNYNVVDSYAYWPTYQGQYTSMIGTLYSILGDGPSMKTLMWIHPEAGGNNPKGQEVGVPGRLVNTAIAGTRWYFNDNAYIRLSSISVNGNTSEYTLSYQFCINGSVAFTLNSSVGKGGWTPFFPLPYNLLRGRSFDGTLFSRNEYSVPTDFAVYHNIYYGYANINNRVGGSISATNYNNWIAAIAGSEIDPDNPYAPGGTSDEGDEPEGNFSEDSDDVSPDALPDEYHYSAVGSGLVTLFSPTITQLNRLSAYFWSSNVRDFILNNVAGVSEMFISLGLLPFQQSVGATVNPSWFDISDTTLRLTLAAKQFYEFDMGSIDLGNDSRIFTSGSALDYSPYSRLGIYLPFIGYQELDVDECRGSVLNLKYRIDVLTGCCVAIISISGKTLYQFAGNCLTQIPITSRDMSGLLTSATQIITAGVGLGIAGAVASAGAEVSAERMAAEEMTAAEGELASVQRAGRVSSAKGVLASSTANAAMGIKPTYKKTGAISASNSLLAVKQPYLFLITPRQSLPERYQKYCGFPSNITGKLNTFSGYTVVEDIRLNGLVATSSEVEEIYKLLKTGVII